MAAAGGFCMTVTCRSARPDDAAALDRIFRTSFCDTFAHLYSSDDLEAFLSAFTIASWESQVRDPRYSFSIVEDAGTAVGYLKLGPMKLPLKADATALLLDQLYVLREQHGTGVSHMLMDSAFAESRHRGARELYLTVYVDNERAKRFYERYGFEAVGRYDFMVGSHADEDIIMRKGL
jgi:ribosomal protein S18 acetylase RimI-like enzyme